MKELNVNQLENLEGGRFWGTECGDWGHIGGGCYVRTCTYDVFWIEVTSWQEFQGNCHGGIA